jgi:hypothetical protein
MAEHLDLIIAASADAKICLNCDRQKCRPVDCKRYNKIHGELMRRSKKDGNANR